MWAHILMQWLDFVITRSIITRYCMQQAAANDKALVHYSDVIMGVMASQITSLTIVYSTVYSDAGQRKHQSSASLAFVWGIRRGPVNSPHKGPVTRKMFPFDDVIMFSVCCCLLHAMSRHTRSCYHEISRALNRLTTLHISPWLASNVASIVTTLISQIPQRFKIISHNAPFCNRHVHRCAHFCCKLVHCGIWDWRIVGYGTGALWDCYKMVHCEILV